MKLDKNSNMKWRIKIMKSMKKKIYREKILKKKIPKKKFKINSKIINSLLKPKYENLIRQKI